jgi:hypothetical protein
MKNRKLINVRRMPKKVGHIKSVSNIWRRTETHQKILVGGEKKPPKETDNFKNPNVNGRISTEMG